MQGQHFSWTFCEPYFYFSSVFKSLQGGGEDRGGTKRAYYVAARGTPSRVEAAMQIRPFNTVCIVSGPTLGVGNKLNLCKALSKMSPPSQSINKVKLSRIFKQNFYNPVVNHLQSCCKSLTILL